jgi:hypothetical protein
MKERKSLKSVRAKEKERKGKDKALPSVLEVIYTAEI